MNRFDQSHFAANLARALDFQAESLQGQVHEATHFVNHSASQGQPLRTILAERSNGFHGEMLST